MRLDYYDKESLSYFEKTVKVNPASFLTPFVNRLPKRAMVVDIGCGSGRDLKYLKTRGFDAVGIERSAGLALLAREYSGCEVIEADFTIFDFSSLTADGMLLIGALVHTPHDQIEMVLKNIVNGLKRWGIIYISVKKGDKNLKYDEIIALSGDNLSQDKNSRGKGGDFCTAYTRTFYLWNRESIESIFSKIGLKVVSFSETISMLATGERWLGYLLQ